MGAAYRSPLIIRPGQHRSRGPNHGIHGTKACVLGPGACGARRGCRDKPVSIRASRIVKLGDKPKSQAKRVPPRLTGVVERLVFALFVAFDLSGAVPAMMGWLAIKLASNWNRKDIESHANTRAFTFSALLAGLISMLFAALGGLISNG